MSRLLSCVALVATAMLAFALVSGARADDPKQAFEHVRHAELIGQTELSCVDCHRTNARGALRAPSHQSCFGACHGRVPEARRGRASPIMEEQQHVCATCHPADELAARAKNGRAKLTVVRIDAARGVGITMPHSEHNTAACASCHTANSAKRPPHARCDNCHDGKTKGFALSSCKRCHDGKDETPRLVAGSLYPTSYSHDSHDKRAGKPLDCQSCHRGIDTTRVSALPRPTKDSCRGCHDEKSALSMKAPSCGRCHKRAQSRPGRLLPPTVRFKHAAHESAGACVTCHVVDKTGAVSWPSGHTPCSNTDCHANDFASAVPVICGACHVGDEPNRQLHRDRPPPPATELGALFSHKAHLTGPSPRTRASCQACHRVDTTEREQRLPRDHTACSGSGCHTKASPTFDQCEGCHQPGLLASRERDRRSYRWSVRERFRHEPHPPSHASCTDCHTDVLDADALDTISAPAKTTCVGCHDGADAFKITGHRCDRCHLPQAE